MAIIPFLAMTAAEMGKISDFPEKTAWMACHFSPYGLGLSNLPRQLPPHSLILLDDITPIRGHDPEIIAVQLQTCTENLSCCGILLDFQRPDNPETAALVQYLTQALPCSVIVTDLYAKDLTCPVFLPPIPPCVPLDKHIALWEGRDIWLETSLFSESLTLTEHGCTVAPLHWQHTEDCGFADKHLHCHYSVEVKKKSARFTLWRTKDDLIELMEEAQRLGIKDFIGLYQEHSRL